MTTDKPRRPSLTPRQQKANYVGGRPKDETKLNTNPTQVRNRLRRAMRSGRGQDGRIERDMKILYGKGLDEWDLEELARGKPRDKNGNFAGKRPSWITSAVVAEAKRRLLGETVAGLASQLGTALDTVKHIMNDNEVDDKGRPITDSATKLKAAQFVIEHIIGKPEALVKLEGTETARQAIAAAIVLDDGQGQDHFVLEGEIVDGDSDDGK